MTQPRPPTPAPPLASRSGSTGMVLGKFLPPHIGHQYLVDFARNYVDALTVVVGTLKAEPIPGDLSLGEKVFPLSYNRSTPFNRERARSAL